MSTITPENWCTKDPASPSPEAAAKVVPGLASSLCSLGWRPIFITGLLRDMLARHFATPLNMEEPDLRRYVWSDSVRTGILIESIHRWRGELVEKRPALILKRNAYQNTRIGIGDKAGTDGHGNNIYCTLWVGSHTVFAIHGSGAGAEILATEVQRELTQFGPLLIQYLGLMKCAVTEVGAIGEIEEAKESFVVPITVGWAYQETWKLSRESLKLRKVPLRTILSC